MTSVRLCPNCAAEQPPPAIHCRVCGAKLVDPQPSTAQTPEPGYGGRERRSATRDITLIAGVFVTVLVLALLAGVAGLLPGWESDEQPAPAHVTVLEAQIGPAGGTFPITDQSSALAGATLLAPAGAIRDTVAVSVRIIDAAPVRLDRLAEDNPAVAIAVMDHALNETLHPIGAPLSMLANSRPAGPSLELQPSGAAFTSPLELRLPLTAYSVDDGEFPLVMLQDASGRWQVLPGARVDESSGMLVVPIPHFSNLSIWSIASNFWNNPTASTDMATFSSEYQRLPATWEWDLYQATYCAGVQPRTTTSTIPDIWTTLAALGWEESRIETPGYLVERELQTWIRNDSDLARDVTARGNPHPPPLPLAELFGKAIQLTEGDAWLALVAIHNVLRDGRDSVGIHDGLEDWRGDGAQGGDARGARYHLFGMAMYSFAYEYWRDRGELSAFAVSPETAARLEEAWVSGDIRSDVTEYVVDTIGARVGRELFRFYRQIERGTSQYELASFFKPEDCGLLRASGPVVQDMEGWEPLFPVNRIDMLISTRSGRVSGEYESDMILPVGFFAELGESIGSALGETLGEALTGPFVPGEDEPPAVDEQPSSAAGGTDCLVLFRRSGTIEGFFYPEADRIEGKHDETILMEITGDCTEYADYIADLQDDIDEVMADGSVGRTLVLESDFDADILRLTLWLAAGEDDEQELTLPVTVVTDLSSNGQTPEP